MIRRKAYSIQEVLVKAKEGRSDKVGSHGNCPHSPSCGVCGSHVDSCHMNLNGLVVRQRVRRFVDCGRGCPYDCKASR
eukprot:6184647-Pleurochrysis_carterae.AAC.1